MRPFKKLKASIKDSLDYVVSQSALAVRAGAVEYEDRLMLAQGRQLANWACNLKNVSQLEDAEFCIFSQWGDDGIIQYIISHIGNLPRTFIEFGVEDYRESNTRFLLMNDNWSGLVMDGSQRHIDSITRSYYYWRYELLAKAAFITTKNINGLLMERPFGDVGILHIDIDGNDYWVWKAIEGLKPSVVMMEYNSVFGADRAISVPYAPDFQRTKAHYSNLYCGASLPALAFLASEKGYALIGSNSAGNNAYFIRSELVNDSLPEIPVEKAYRRSKFRESRGKAGELTYLAGDNRLRLLSGLPVTNVKTGAVEEL